MTPEGRVKEKVRQALKDAGAWYFMPVQTGYGRRALDFVCCHRGRFFTIETKAAGKKPTPLQLECIRAIEAAGGECFVIDGTERTDTIEDLGEYLQGGRDEPHD